MTLRLRPAWMLSTLERRAYRTGMAVWEFVEPENPASQVIVRVEPKEFKPEIQNSRWSCMLKSSM